LRRGGVAEDTARSSDSGEPCEVAKDRGGIVGIEIIASGESAVDG
jgi:hypothetical protein